MRRSTYRKRRRERQDALAALRACIQALSPPEGRSRPMTDEELERRREELEGQAKMLMERYGRRANNEAA